MYCDNGGKDGWNKFIKNEGKYDYARRAANIFKTKIQHMIK